MSNSRISNMIKNSGASILYKLVYTLMRFIMRTAFIKLLGNEYTGLSSLFTDILSVLSLVEMGLDSSMIFSLYKPLAKNETDRIAALMNFYRKAFTIIGILVLFIGAGCVPFLKYIVKDIPNIEEDIRAIFIMYVVTSASSYFFVYKTVLIRADQKSRIISTVSAAVNVVECILEVVLLFWTRQFFAYLIVHLIATISRNIILSWKAKQLYPGILSNKAVKLGKEDKVFLYRNIAALCIYNLASVVLNSSDSIFISAFVGTVEVAIIGNFTLLTRSVTTCIQLVVNAIRPSIGNLVVTSSVEKEKEVFKQVNFVTFWVACFCSTCLITLLNPFVGDIWLDSSYKISTWIVVIIVANFYISVMSSSVGSFRSVNGLYTQGWYRPAVMSMLNIVLDYCMGKRWGVGGIYVATILSLLLTQVWFDPYIVFKYAFHMKPWKYYKDYAIQACVTVLSCSCSFFLSTLFQADNLYVTFLIRMIFAVVVPNVIIVIFFYKKQEFRSIVAMVRRIFEK